MRRYNSYFNIGKRRIAIDEPTYFIADIAANHDGSLNRAIELIHLAKEAGADCAKFQHFKAENIVSDYGFKRLKRETLSHQKNWNSSVAEIYEQYHTRRDWNDRLVEECKKVDIEFMTTPYDIAAINDLIDDVNAIKIGSGDITFLPFLEKLALLEKPILLATGASDLEECIKAVDTILDSNSNLCLMQCNTNYTGDLENFKYVNLNVLKTFSSLYPSLPLGFSDHTPGHAAVLGAITLGARVIEKHFTDDNSRVGPDHHFALNPLTWREMVERSRELEMCLGDGIKRIETNELETVVIQRRALRASKNIEPGSVITSDMVTALRPCPNNAIPPSQLDMLIGRKLRCEKSEGDHFEAHDIEAISDQ